MWWNKYIGRRFEEKGRGPDTFDCWGLGMWIARHDNPKKIILPDYLECYESVTEKRRLAAVITDQSQKFWKQVDKPEPFDFVLCRIVGFPMHIGVVTRPGHMIHCGKGFNTVHEKLDSIRWHGKILGFWRYESDSNPCRAPAIQQ